MPSSGESDERALLDLSNHLVALPVDKRRAYILKHTPPNSLLREKALRLLDLHHSSPGRVGTSGALRFLDEITTPESIGPFKVISRLGAGSMGAVFLAQKANADFDRLVAIKLVPSLAETPTLKEAVRSERKVLAELRHQHIAQLYDGGETENGTPYLVMEFIDGLPLADLLNDSKFGLPQRLDFFRQVCRGISYAHEEGVRHGDISLANILVDKHGMAKIVDFGISSKQSSGSETQNQDAWHEGDIRDLGKILRSLLTGQSYPRKKDLAAVIANAMGTEHTKQYETVTDLLEDLDAYSSCRVVSVRGRSFGLRATRFLQRHPRTLATAIMFAVFGGMAIAVITDANMRAEARLSQAREIAANLIRSVDADGRQDRSQIESRAGLLTRALTTLEDLEKTSGPSELKLEIALGYARLAEVVGVGGGSNLGDRTQAEGFLLNAWRILEDLPPKIKLDDTAKSVLLETTVLSARNERYLNNSDLTAAELVATAETTFAEISQPSKQDRLNLAAGRKTLARAHLHSGEPQAGIDAANASIITLENLLEDYPGDQTVLLSLSEAFTALAQAKAWAAYYAEQPYDEAIYDFDQGVELARTQSGLAGQRVLAIALLNRANTTCYTDAFRSSGLQDLEEAEDIATLLKLTDPSDAQISEIQANIVLQLADCLFNASDAQAAIDAAQRAVAMQQSALMRDPDSPGRIYRVIVTARTLRWIQAGSGDSEGACETATRIKSAWEHYDSASTVPRTDAMQVAFEANETLLEDCN